MRAGERVVLDLLCDLFLPGEVFDALQVYPSHKDHARRAALERLARDGLVGRAGDGYRVTLHTYDAAGRRPPRRAG